MSTTVTITSFATPAPEPMTSNVLEPLWITIRSISYALFHLVSILFSLVSKGTIYTVTATITLDIYGLLWISAIVLFLLWIVARYRYLNVYSRLEQVKQPQRALDLQPDIVPEDDSMGYPDEFMNAFLSSIKVFGYLDKPVFHELARHLQTKKLHPGQLLFEPDTPDLDFYVVVDGTVDLFVRTESVDPQEEETDDYFPGHQLLHSVGSGQTISSLFTILELFTRDFKLPNLSDLSRTPSKDDKSDIIREASGEPEHFKSETIALDAKTTESPLKDLEDIGTQSEPLIAHTKSNISHAESVPDDSVFPRLYEKSTEQSEVKLEDIRSVHPQLVARAKVSTTLAVIPAKAFVKLTESFPKAAAHISQVILTRFQRVTFLTLYNYLGMTHELLAIEKRVNEIAAQGLPPHLFQRDLIDDYLWKHVSTHPEDWKFSSFNERSASPTRHVKKKRSKIMSLDIDVSDHGSTHPDEDPAEILSENVFKCMSHMLGINSTREKRSSISLPSRPSSRGLPPLNAERFYFANQRKMSRNSSGWSRPRGSSYLDADDLDTPSLSSRTSSYGHDSDEEEEEEVVIQHYKHGDVLIKKGQRNPGLYFVIDGILEASTAPRKVLNVSAGDRGQQFKIHPGGLAGYLSALTGNVSFVTITAYTDCLVGFMGKKAIDRYVEMYPNISLCLAKRLVSQLTPLVFHVDVALEWGQMNAGQVVCKQGDQAHAIYLVLNGRLRSLATREDDTLQVYGEYGQGESVGEMEVLMDIPRPATVHAIRDSEIAILPKTLFSVLAIRHPDIMLSMARIMATRASQKTREHNVDNVNLKTVCLLPVSNQVPLLEFSERLMDSLEMIGSSACQLSSSIVTQQLGKHAFTRLGRLKLMSWLAEQEDNHRLVLYVADGGPNSPWTQRCIRQADCILVVGFGDLDESLGENERLLAGIKTTARKELVLLHAKRTVLPGSTARWLKIRPWIQFHHHVQMQLPANILAATPQKKQFTVLDLGIHFQSYYDRIASDPNQKLANNGLRSDFGRLARRLLSKSIGLVLGGGGARGIAHVGMIRAFEEAGLPFDAIGGTSMGSFVGGLYAKHGNQVSIVGRAKLLSSRIVSPWRNLIDLTYPITAMTTGHEFNRAIWKSFSDTLIEDCWIPYFCTCTNITHSRLDIAYTGYMWRYIRASMSLSGFVPPLSDNGNLLLDGGYCNNLPADIMRSWGAQHVIAIDVGSTYDTSPVQMSDSVSGWWVLLNRYNPFWGKSPRLPELSEIQSRLAYVSSVKQLEDVKRQPGCIYLVPPITDFGLMDFGRYNEIEQAGYEYAKKVLREWEASGVLESIFGIKPMEAQFETSFVRRASI
ncbi:hypothetical protein EDD86DRAFT_196717 [Gorgonomyces haynaldii]|nr:hypothetical protein EDD86DRAFT_196717 [Gorgonomyces haynaldii]